MSKLPNEQSLEVEENPPEPVSIEEREIEAETASAGLTQAEAQNRLRGGR